MKNHDGRSDILRYVDHLGQAATECERRVRDGTVRSPAEAAAIDWIGKMARAGSDDLAAADDRKQWAVAEAQRADLDLESRYHEARDCFDKVRAGLFAVYGQEPAQLVPFGVAAPWRARKRYRTESSKGLASPPAAEPAPTAGASVATAAEWAALEVSHHG